MKTKCFKLTAVVLTVLAAMLMISCENPFIYEGSDSGNNSSNNSTVKPGVPTGVMTTAATSNSITISWTAVFDATGYYIYRSSSSTGTFTQVGNIKSSSYTNTGLTAGTTYYYKVAAYNNAGTSSQSSTLYAATNSSALFSITISGTPKTGQIITAVTNGSGWTTGSFKWGYADSANADYFYYFTSGMSGLNDSVFTIPAGYTGKYIRAFRYHPSGDWHEYSTTGQLTGNKSFASNFLGPVQY